MTLPEMLTATAELKINNPATLIKTYPTPVHAKIQALDLEPIKFKLIKEKGWPLKKADAVEKLYKAYLLLFALYPAEEHVPTADIDEMWHGHILDTQKYMVDCHDIFGYYLHHYPYLGMLGEEDAVLATAQFTATRNRFLEIAGVDLIDAAHCGGGCGGHGCGGHSCSSHSCSGHGGGDSGGHHDGGHSHNDPSPIISSCTSPSSIPSKPLRDEWKRKKEKPAKKTPANENPGGQKKKPFWKRIIGALQGQPKTSGPEIPAVQAPKPQTKWEKSVDPRLNRTKGRPTRADLLQLLETVSPETATRH